MSEDIYTAALTVLFWCGLFVFGGCLVLAVAFLYRLIVERVAGRLAGRPQDLSDQTWRARR